MSRTSLVLLAASLILVLAAIAVVGSRARPSLDVSTTIRAYDGVLVPALAGDGPVDRQWLRFTAVPLPDGRVAFIGDGIAFLQRPTLIWDPGTGAQTTLGVGVRRREAPTPIFLDDGRILLLGDDTTEPVGSAESYEMRITTPTTAEILDPRTGASTFAGQLRTSRWLFAAARMADGRVLITGGRDPDDTAAVGTAAEIYDPVAGTFTSTGSMLESRAAHSLTLLPDGRVLVAGGGSGSLEVFDPVAGTFTSAGAAATVVSVPPVTLPDGRVLVIGGRCAEISNQPARNRSPVPAEILDTVTMRLTSQQPLPHCVHTATALPNGEVFVTSFWGARDLPGGIATWSGLYDPATGQTRQTAAPMGGFYTQAILLADGRVLLAGQDVREVEGPQPAPLHLEIFK